MFRLGTSRSKILSAVIFAILFLYTWLVIEPCLIFHGAGTIPNFPIFKTGLDPFLAGISRPGGTVEYIAAFLAQLFSFSWLGAAIIVGLGWALFFVTDAFIRLIGDSSLRFLRFTGPLALFVTFARYRFELSAYLAFLISMGLAVIVCRWSFRLNVLWQLAGTVAIYQLAGGAFIVYALCCALYERRVRGRQQRWRAVVHLASLALIPFGIGVLVYGYGPWEAYTLILPFSPGILVHLFVPVSTSSQDEIGGLSTLIEIVTAMFFYLIVALPLLAKTLRGLIGTDRAKSWHQVAGARRLLRNRIFQSLAIAVTIIGLVGAPDFFKKDFLESDYLAYHGRWAELIERAHGYSNNPLILNSVNRALFHTGALANRMFEFHQTGADVLLLGREPQVPFSEQVNFKAPSLWRRAQLHIDLGLLSVAKLELIILTDWMGFRPLIFRKLALLSLATGDKGSARILLGELSQSFLDSQWAAKKLTMMNTDEQLAADPEIRWLRERRCATDETSSMYAVQDIFDLYIDDAETLNRILAGCPNNRMAAEYLGAFYLLERQLDAFTAMLAKQPETPGRTLPVHYQEALALRQNGAAEEPLADRFAVDPAVVDRLAAYRSWRERRANGERSDGGAFQTTYWYYYDQARSPAGVAP
ncbi:MAG: hypothetical protein GX444_03985 [Myxococcales bacterium]|nr:hypothetical protein [Myxococcales bacterium]